MAMLPFCGYNMGDYFGHWLKMGKKIKHLPRIFHVNWFRTDEDGNFLWPGFGENLRVLKWILERTDRKTEAIETPIGFVPEISSLDLEGLDVSTETIKKLLEVDTADWEKELLDIKEFFSQFGEKLPQELRDELNYLESRLKKTKLPVG